MDDTFFSTFQVAKMCHVSPGSVIRWIHEGKLPAAVTAGGHHRISGANVKKLLQTLKMPLPPVLTEKNKPDPVSANGQIKVLIVDDETAMRSLVRSVLEQEFDNLKIEEAGEGFQAGWKANGMRPDLVILDIVLPGSMTGFSVCQLIRSIPELNRTRIIAMTGMGIDEAEEKMLHLGADDLLAKPFDPDELKERVQHQLLALGVKNHVRSE